MYYKVTQLFTALVMLAALTPVALAHTEVTNNVSATANSGGNVAHGDETVVEGESSAHIFVETTVNGETVQNVDESTTGTEGGSVRLEHTSTITTEGGTTTVAGTTTSNQSAHADGAGQAPENNEDENNEESRRSFLTIITSFFAYVRNIFTF